jgi:hypothetical protein
MARTILPATVLPNSPIHHARSRTTAHLQRTRPTQDADYKRNLLQHQISGQAEEHRLRRSVEDARLKRKRLADLETERRPELIEKMNSFIDYCITLVDRKFAVMILGCLVLLCGRGFSQNAPKPSSFDAAVQSWSEEHIDAETKFAYVVFVEPVPVDAPGRSGAEIKYLRFRMCMNSVKMAKLDPKVRPTPEHVQICDRLIDRLEREAKSQPKW